MGVICQTAYKAREEYNSGNVRSTLEMGRDLAISATAGAFTGSCVAAFPITALFSGVIYTGISLSGRASWAIGDGSMTDEGKKAYIFDKSQMAVDFTIGNLIGIFVPGAAARKVAKDAEKNMIKLLVK